ncbi:MAG: hypothetical protein ACRD41_07040, partial [Candidatus Acidiferrales bacterium]
MRMPMYQRGVVGEKIEVRITVRIHDAASLATLYKHRIGKKEGIGAGVASGHDPLRCNPEGFRFRSAPSVLRLHALF